MFKMPEFRSGKRKDGSKYSFPLTESGREARPEPVTIINLKKPSGWGKFSEQDIIHERDLLPNVNPDSDYRVF